MYTCVFKVVARYRKAILCSIRLHGAGEIQNTYILKKGGWSLQHFCPSLESGFTWVVNSGQPSPLCLHSVLFILSQCKSHKTRNQFPSGGMIIICLSSCYFGMPFFPISKESFVNLCCSLSDNGKGCESFFLHKSVQPFSARVLSFILMLELFHCCREG